MLPPPPPSCTVAANFFIYMNLHDYIVDGLPVIHKQLSFEILFNKPREGLIIKNSSSVRKIDSEQISRDSSIKITTFYLLTRHLWPAAHLNTFKQFQISFTWFILYIVWMRRKSVWVNKLSHLRKKEYFFVLYFSFFVINKSILWNTHPTFSSFQPRRMLYLCVVTLI